MLPFYLLGETRIREDELKEVLSYTVAPTKSAFVWEEVLQDLKKRGIREVLLFISDGLKGMRDRLSSVFPDAKYHLAVYITRHMAHKVRITDRKEICEEVCNSRQSAEQEKTLYS